ncbi:MAG: FMN-binding protein [Firmicutes bacterium]|nr:FMN-binding protein [Bacillota bacterium]
MVRLVLTLVAVTVVAAALLAGVDLITAPVIAERQEEDYRSALEEYFPAMARYESKELEEDSFDLVYDKTGGLLGVMASSAVQGYDDQISYNLALDRDGLILGLRIVEHSETQGVGDVIEKPEFQSQFLGRHCRDPLQLGEDVDTISGATISTEAMILSLRRLLSAAAENFFDFAEEAPLDIAALPDGVYRGSGEGFGGEIGVAVTVEGGKIIDLEIVEHNEKPTYLAEAVALIPPQIIEGQTLDVDTKTGATESSAAIVSAVREALLKALSEEEDSEGGESDG